MKGAFGSAFREIRLFVETSVTETNGMRRARERYNVQYKKAHWDKISIFFPLHFRPAPLISV